jgi:hypothetical protein
MSPVEFCFHDPEGDLRSVLSLTATQQQAWVTIRKAAEGDLRPFLEHDAIDQATQHSLRHLSDTLRQATTPSDIRAQDAEVYDPGLRWNLDRLREQVREVRSADGTPIPVRFEAADNPFLDQRLSFHGKAATDACRYLAWDVASNLCASSVFVTLGGQWPREGWFAVWGDVAKSKAEIEEVFRTSLKGPTGLRFLAHYFSCFRFCDVGSGPIPVPQGESGFLLEPGELEEQLKTLGATRHNKAGYVMVLREFPAAL